MDVLGYDLTMQLPLVEKFFSVQGEGKNAGCAAFFIRFSGCNLDCRFADGAVCDTPWQKAREKITLGELGEWLQMELRTVGLHYPEDGWCTRQDLLDAEPYPKEPYEDLPMVIITGGEPTMARAFDALVIFLKTRGFYVAVESNGTRFREGLKWVDWLVVSPKFGIEQGNPLGSSTLDPNVALRVNEYRFVVEGSNAETPPYIEGADAYFVSPAFMADGSGTEHNDPNYVPRLVPGAVMRCLNIVQRDPRWRMSIQSHKFLRVR